MLSGFSFIICFWAEVSGRRILIPIMELFSPFKSLGNIQQTGFLNFLSLLQAFHLGDIKFDKPRFLGKSIIGFLVFNFLMYSLLFIQLVATDVIDDPITTVILFSFYFVNVWLKDLLIFFNFFMRERERERVSNLISCLRKNMYTEKSSKVLIWKIRQNVALVIKELTSQELIRQRIRNTIEIGSIINHLSPLCSLGADHQSL